MAGTTGIEWCDATFNPWWGCEKVSPACAHCYADTLSKRYAAGKQLWGDGHEFRFFGDKHWAEPLKWARLLPAKLGRRPRVFTASMADVFEERDELGKQRERLFQLITDTPELDWLVLTKRPEFARDWLIDFFHGELPRNVWMGVSIENARYTWRADVLREIPAAVRFISAEPLLGSLFKFESRSRPGAISSTADWRRHEPGAAMPRAALDLTGIDWVIAGGESGPKARPSHPDWFREIRDECMTEKAVRYTQLDHGFGRRTGGPAFFFKQWGEWAPGALPLSLNGRPIGPQVTHVAVKSGRGYSSVMARLGKKRAGRALDGRVWDEFPQSAGVPA